VGHVSPEAAEGGAIGLVRDGDAITIDVDARIIRVDVPDAELARRREAFRPRKKEVRSSWLRRYAHLVTNAARGAVMRSDV
jgi:dihydroxy-acid dehydratase